MAEAMLRAFSPADFDAFSAGTEATSVRTEAIQVMDEIGIDISAQQSKSLEGYLHEPFDWLITVCDRARQNCPVFPGVEQSAHWGVDDPTEETGSQAVRLEAFRRARDDLRSRIRLFIAAALRPDLPHQSAETIGA
jgi:arsenate reductase (thioredoxin)